MEKEKSCSVEERNALLKKPVLDVKDIKVLFACKDSVAYRYIEIINYWLAQNGRVPLVEKEKKGLKKKIRTVDYLDFVGLPHSLMM